MTPDPPLPDDLRRALAEVRRVFGPSAQVVDVEETTAEADRSGVVHHVQLAMPGGVRAARQARAFYGEVLGMTEIPRPEELEGAGVWFRAGTLELHLETTRRFRPARTPHPSIVVDDDGDGLAARLRHHATPTESDEEKVPGHQHFGAHDPFGNHLEFLVPEVPEPPETES